MYEYTVNVKTLKELKELASRHIHDTSTPKRVIAHYFYTNKEDSRDKKEEKKDIVLVWFLFRSNLLDAWNRRMHLTHRAFVKENEKEINFAEYTIYVSPTFKVKMKAIFTKKA